MSRCRKLPAQPGIICSQIVRMWRPPTSSADDGQACASSGMPALNRQRPAAPAANTYPQKFSIYPFERFQLYCLSMTYKAVHRRPKGFPLSQSHSKEPPS